MQEKYKKFYDQYRNKLFSYLVYLSGDPETSKDIMQESFTRHFKYYRDDPAASPALLFTIARNALIDHHRGQNRFRDEPVFIDEVVVDEEQSIIVREDCKRVRQSLARLNKTDQEILSMAVSGVAYKEIATVMGISESSVKVRIHRTRTKLRQMLSDEEAS